MSLTHDVAGRDRVAASLLNEGPATASILATRLGISATAVRRHLDNLAADGWVAGHRAATVRSPADPGAWTPGSHLRADGSGSLTVPGRVRRVGGRRARLCRAGRRCRCRHRFRRVAGLLLWRLGSGQILGDDWQSASDIEQVRAFAAALGDLGFATSVDPAPAGVQVCQHHCPVAHVAGQYPQLCEAETEAFARLLGRPRATPSHHRQW